MCIKFLTGSQLRMETEVDKMLTILFQLSTLSLQSMNIQIQEINNENQTQNLDILTQHLRSNNQTLEITSSQHMKKIKCHHMQINKNLCIMSIQILLLWINVNEKKVQITLQGLKTKRSICIHIHFQINFMANKRVIEEFYLISRVLNILTTLRRHWLLFRNEMLFD